MRLLSENRSGNWALRARALTRLLRSLSSSPPAGPFPERFSFSWAASLTSRLACQYVLGFQRYSAKAEQRSCELADRRLLVRICELASRAREDWPGLAS